MSPNSRQTEQSRQTPRSMLIKKLYAKTRYGIQAEDQI